MISLSDEQTVRLADAVRDRRRDLGLTQEEAADAAGMSKTTWRYVEYAKRNGMRDDTAEGLCRALRWSRAELLASAGAPDPDEGPLLRFDGPGESFTCRVLDDSDDVIDRVRRAAHSWEQWTITWANPPAGSREAVVKHAADDPDRARLLALVRRLPADAVPRALGYLDALGTADAP